MVTDKEIEKLIQKLCEKGYNRQILLNRVDQGEDTREAIQSYLEPTKGNENAEIDRIPFYTNMMLIGEHGDAARTQLQVDITHRDQKGFDLQGYTILNWQQNSRSPDVIGEHRRCNLDNLPTKEQFLKALMPKENQAQTVPINEIPTKEKKIKEKKGKGI